MNIFAAIVTHQQMNRHRTSAIMWVFPEASCSTLVAMLARQDGQVKRVESGPTATLVSTKSQMAQVYRVTDKMIKKNIER